jgi:RecB family exonuclease
MTAWSYSSIKTFDQCPKKYFHLKVVKDVKDEPGEAADYGTAVHEAAELFITQGAPIPEKFAFMRPIVEPLARKQGTKYAEIKLGVAKIGGEFQPRGFFDKDVWYRGIADLLIVNGSKAWLVDYKTGKNAKYADMKQLDLLAGAVFVHFPKVETINSALLYVISQEMPKKTHQRENMAAYMSVFNTELDRLEGALENGIWNAKSSPLCGWCPVEACEHWRPRRK